MDNEKNEVLKDGELTLMEIEPLYERAALKNETFNKEKRTFDVVFSTGARVQRQPFFSEPFYIQLAMEKKNVNLKRLNAGAPFLKNHNSDEQIGVVERAKVDGKEGTAKVRLSKREDVEPIALDIEDGIIQNISVGFQIHKLVELEEKQNDLKVFEAQLWEPIELSAVPAGADPGAQIRSQENLQKNICEIYEKRSVMDKKNEKGTEEKPAGTPESSVEKKDEPINDGERTLNKKSTGDIMDKEKEMKIRQEAQKAEKERQKEIKFAVKAAGLDEKLADEMIDSEKSIDEVRAVIITKLAEKDKENETQNVVTEVTEVDTKELRQEGMSEAILHRLGRNDKPLNENSKRFAYLSMLELAKRSLEAQGQNTTGLTPMQVAKRAFQAVSDFPEILANTAEKTLRRAYDAAPQTFAPFTRSVTVRDFKQVSRIQFGDAPDLELVPENAAFPHGSIGEAAEKYQIATYGKIVAYSRQALINDDLSAFDRTAELMGRAARDLESDLIWDAVIANAAMADSIALFHASHGNLSGAAADPSITTMSAVRSAMRLQVGLGGRLLNIGPSWIWVPAALETTAEQLIAPVRASEQDFTNPFASGGRTPLSLIVEPRLDADSTAHWYASATLEQIDMYELARLEGQEGPMVESRVGFDVDGMEIKIRHDVGQKAIDYRGMYKYGV
jgi:hypothetical protein